MREVENLPFGPTARWTSLNLVGSSTYGKKTEEVAEGGDTRHRRTRATHQHKRAPASL